MAQWPASDAFFLEFLNYLTLHGMTGFGLQRFDTRANIGFLLERCS